MRPMRSALLWASTNPWLAQQLPRRAFARRAVRRFMPGESLDDALAAARRLQDAGFPTVITQLGENIGAAHDADHVADHYQRAIDRIATEQLDCQLSVKPTQLGLDVDSDLCRATLERLAAAAAARGNRIWIDMESSPYTSSTIALFRLLRAHADNVGLCLQANLRRTASDLAELAPLSPSIRLVKGAYAEPADRAFERKGDVDAAYFRLAESLLHHVRDPRRPVLAVATHDVPLVRRIADAGEKLGVARKDFEVQMLYGIRTAEQQLLRSDGFRVRVLISYGAHWFPWYMRRLAERPANVWFVLKSVVAR